MRSTTNRVFLTLILLLPTTLLTAQDEEPKGEPSTDSAPAEKDEGSQSSLRRLSEKYPLWIDSKRKMVVMDGKVCLREGQLEMFACTKGTKEHESIVVVDVKQGVIRARHDF